MSSSMLGHHYKIRVMLTATSNTFLADQLPTMTNLNSAYENFQRDRTSQRDRVQPGRAVSSTNSSGWPALRH